MSSCRFLEECPQPGQLLSCHADLPRFLLAKLPELFAAEALACLLL